MALEFIRDHGTGAHVEATARLYRTESGEFVGEDYTGPERKHLYCAPGQRILRDDAERHGLLGTAAKSEPEPEPDTADPKAVRAWAKDQGLDVPARGKIPDEVYELYAESQQESGDKEPD